jgi:hypothetical protein
MGTLGYIDAKLLGKFSVSLFHLRWVHVKANISVFPQVGQIGPKQNRPQVKLALSQIGQSNRPQVKSAPVQIIVVLCFFI